MDKLIRYPQIDRNVAQQAFGLRIYLREPLPAIRSAYSPAELCLDSSITAIAAGARLTIAASTAVLRKPKTGSPRWSRVSGETWQYVIRGLRLELP